MATRPTSASRVKPANTSFVAKKSSISPVRRLPRSNNTSPIRSYISPLKDYSNYTPLLLSRSSKTTPKHTLSTSFSSEEVAKPRKTTRPSALDSMHDLRSKTDKLDHDSKKFAEKVVQVRQQLQRNGRARSVTDNSNKKSLPRACAKVLSRAVNRVLSLAIDKIHAKAKKIEVMERQGQRFCFKLRAKQHFSAWMWAMHEQRENGAVKLEIAVTQYRITLKKRTFRVWKSQKSAETAKIPNVSPKIERRPLTSSNTKKRTPSESPKPAKSSIIRREEGTVRQSQNRKIPVKAESPTDEVSEALYSLAVQHHRFSAIVSVRQFYNVWKPWKAAAFEKRDRAVKHHRRVVGAKVFHTWLEFYVESCEGRESPDVHVLLADSFEEAASTSHYDPIIAAFRLVLVTQQTIGATVMSRWKEFMTVSRSEKEQEHRRDMMWRKVNSWLEQYKTQP